MPPMARWLRDPRKGRRLRRATRGRGPATRSRPAHGGEGRQRRNPAAPRPHRRGMAAMPLELRSCHPAYDGSIARLRSLALLAALFIGHIAFALPGLVVAVAVVSLAPI